MTIRMAWDIKKERVLYSPGPRSICGCIRHGSRTHGTGVQDRQNNCKKETTGMDTFEKIRALLAEQLDVGKECMPVLQPLMQSADYLQI